MKNDDKAQRWLVRLSYQEPTWDEANERPVRTFTGSFTVLASDDRGAIGAAVAEFRRIAALSSVSWPREVVGAEATALSDAA